MAITNWAFAGYTFPVADQPSKGGAGEWNRERKVAVSQPINSSDDVLTNFGFTSARRTISGRCSQAFRNQMRTFFNNLTEGTLTDSEGGTQKAQILELSFDEQVPERLYAYTVVFIARP